MTDNDEVLFYHFTKPMALPMIYHFGICKGEVPVSFTERFNAVWLTVDPNAKHFQILDAPEETIDRRKVRITLCLEPDDPKLMAWSKVAKKYDIDPDYLNAFNNYGGGYSDGWWVYLGAIPPERFDSVRIRLHGENHECTTKKEALQRIGQTHVSMSMFLSPPECPLQHWPTLAELKLRKCGNPNCKVDASVKATLFCSRCNATPYHNKACQVEHWRHGHKSQCRKTTEKLNMIENGQEA